MVDRSWKIEQVGYDPTREREMEVIFSLSNGLLGVRGSSVLPIPSAQPDLYVAGIYDRKVPSLPYSEVRFLTRERTELNETEIASYPSPFLASLCIDGKRFHVGSSDPAQYRRTLDLRRGLLLERMVFLEKGGSALEIRSLRCVSQADPNLLLEQLEFRWLEGSSPAPGVVEMEGWASQGEFHLRWPHQRQLFRAEELWEPLGSVRCFRTRHSGHSICIGGRAWLDGKSIPDASLRWFPKPGNRSKLRQVFRVDIPREEAPLEGLRGWEWRDFDQCLERHDESWARLWEGADVRFIGSPESTQAMRFNLFHLLGAAAREPNTSVPARAWSGRAYEGHVFWDSEIFILPFYIHCLQERARNLLLYRHATLDGARRRALDQGLRGACFAWESTRTGADVTPAKIVLRVERDGEERVIPIFTGAQQIHVTADIAHGVWKYWEATRDEEFLARYGAELLFETARFWASRAESRQGTCHLLRVVGPDEYHSNVNNNAFTNWMARANLERAVLAAELLQELDPKGMEDLGKKLRLAPEEIREWTEIGRRLYFPDMGSSGVIEQFEGFFKLRSSPLTSEDRFRPPLQRLYRWQELNGLKILKQADVLMLPFLFPEAFPKEIVEANFRYYEPLTDHGSSLSPPVHAAIAGRLGLSREAEEYWRKSIYFDLDNVMRNTALGTHIGCMGAVWQAVVFHFCGIRSVEGGGNEEGQPMAPDSGAFWLPPGCQSVELSFGWRGRVHPLQVHRGRAAA